MKKQKISIGYAPSFAESLSKLDLSPEEKQELLDQVGSFVEKLRDNPYLGTPVDGDPLAVFANWVRRICWRIGLRW